MAAKRLHLQSLEKESSMPSTDPENNILPEGKVTPYHCCADCPPGYVKDRDRCFRTPRSKITKWDTTTSSFDVDQVSNNEYDVIS